MPTACIQAYAIAEETTGDRANNGARCAVVIARLAIGAVVAAPTISRTPIAIAGIVAATAVAAIGIAALMITATAVTIPAPVIPMISVIAVAIT